MLVIELYPGEANEVQTKETREEGNVKTARSLLTAACACALVASLVGPAVEVPAAQAQAAQVQETEEAGQQDSAEEEPDAGQQDSAQAGDGSTDSSASDAGKASAAKKDAQKLTAAEKKYVEKADESSAKAASIISGFSSQKDKVSKATADVHGKRIKLDKLRKQKEQASKEAAQAAAEVDAAAEELDAVRVQESSLNGITFFSLLFGEVRFDDLVERSSSLEQQEAQAAAALEECQQKRDGLQAQEDKLAKKVSAQEESIAEAVSAGNEAAYELEKADSSSRMADEDAAGQVEKLSAKKPKAKQAKKRVEDSVKSHDVSRKRAREVLAGWYDEVDALSGVDSCLVFGTSADFSLSQEEFVEKWGAAIDRFYEKFGAKAGFTPPLSGQGEVMAKYAYEFEVDPRLCAAVSIVESSGGQHCIKPHNAWGWGAADSDPYGGAASWDSWEEAICAWHAGMAGSRSGLASAGCVSELGQTYCSSAHWAKGVIEQFEAIDACL